MWSKLTLQLIDAALEEDLGGGEDLSARLLPGARDDVVARIVARRPGVLCGLQIGPSICKTFATYLGDTLLEFAPTANGGAPHADGDIVESGQAVATVRGPQAAVLTVERTLLNFLGRMSGVATRTRAFVDAATAANPDVKVLDTRKTIPGWRELDKYAVRAGGGHNHRFGLYDAVLIKDNHLADVPTDELADTLMEWLEAGALLAGDDGAQAGLDTSGPQPQFVMVEVDRLEQAVEVFKVSAVDIVLLDNFALGDIRAAVEQRDAQGLKGKLRLEVSGGITVDMIGDIAETGVERISVGALTHSAAALDLGLDF